MLTDIIGANADALCIGQTVTLRFVEGNSGPPVPVFALK